jgi:hypothetical protein
MARTKNTRDSTDISWQMEDVTAEQQLMKCSERGFHAKKREILIKHDAQVL